MAEKNSTQSDKEKKAGASKVVGDFVAKNRIALLAVLVVAFVGIVVYSAASSVNIGAVKKGLDKVAMIEYTLTKEASELGAEEISARQDAALSDLEAYLSKGGIVGARAAMLAADIHTQKKDWETARRLWLDGASKRKGTYIEALCNFNAAMCSEELGDNKAALDCYKKVCEDKNFIDRSRAYFNAGRIQEALEDFDGAKASYEAVALLDYANDIWNDLSKSRLIVLRAEGKIQ